jgi:hypothetical protein
MLKASQPSERLNVRDRFWPDATLPIITGMIGFGICLYGFYPGYMSWDSAYQYWQVRTLQFTTQHPPSMSLLWLVTDSVIKGPAGLLGLHLLVYWSSLVLVSLASFQAAAWRVAFILGVGFWPPHMLLLPHIWKDVAMMVAFLMSFACLLQHRVTGGRGWLVGMCVSTLYAVTVRHNAMIAALPFFAYLGAVLSVGHVRPLLRSVLIWALAVAACGLVVSGINALPVVSVQTVWPSLTLWDMSRVSAKEGVLFLPSYTIAPGRTLADVKAGDNRWDNASTFSNVGIRTGLNNPYTKKQYAEIWSAWVDMVITHPGSYLEHRWEMTKILYGIDYDPATEPGRFDAGITPYRDNPPMQLHESALSDFLIEFLRADLRRVHHSGWVYLLLSTVGGVIAIVMRRARSTWPSLLLYASALSYTLPLCVVSPSSATRFNSWLICGSVVATWLLVSALCVQPENDLAANQAR